MSAVTFSPNISTHSSLAPAPEECPISKIALMALRILGFIFLTTSAIVFIAGFILPAIALLITGVAASIFGHAFSKNPLFDHFPREVVDLIENREYEITDSPTRWDTNLMGTNKLTIAPMDDGALLTIYIRYLVDGSFRNSFSEFKFKNKICTDKEYKHYTKDRASLPSEIVNAIYLETIKIDLALQNSTPKGHSLGLAVQNLVANGILREDQMNGG